VRSHPDTPAVGLERITADALPTNVSSNHTDSGFDGRGDEEGPEPDAVTLGEVGGRTYAILGLERWATS
jgi:hypothetical protein